MHVNMCVYCNTLFITKKLMIMNIHRLINMACTNIYDKWLGGSKPNNK